MAGENWQQKFVTNPVTTNIGTDLMYFARSPYGATNDAVMTYTNFSAQFLLNAANSVHTTNIANSAVTYAKIQNITAGTLLGSISGSAAAPGEVVLDPSLQLTGGALGIAPIPDVHLLGNDAGSTGIPGAIAIGTGLSMSGNILSATSTASGIVSPGLINQIAWYAASGSTVSGLATANNGVLFTSVSGVPSIGTAPIVAGGTGVTAVATAPAATAWAGWDANKNFSSNSFISGYATTATAAGTTTLVVGSAEQQFFTGSTTQTCVMPVTSTLVAGQIYRIVNLSTGVVTVQSSGANSIQAMAANSVLILTVINTGVTTAAGWSTVYQTLAAAASAVSVGSTGTNSAYGGDGTANGFTLGNYSFSYGDSNTKATGLNSFAFGHNTVASDQFAVAMGTGCSTSSRYAFSFGNGSTASNFYAFAFGNTATASNSGTFAFGSNSVGAITASGQDSVAFGSGCWSKGSFSWALGKGATANNGGSVVWFDNSNSGKQDTGVNQFVLSFAGGMQIWQSSSVLGVLSVATLKDINANTILTLSPNASAVNFIGIQNNATGSSPVITAMGSDTNITLQLNGKGTGGVLLIGTSTNDSAAAGGVGEFVSSVIAQASAVSLTTATPANMTSISLTAGDWDVWGNITFTSGGTTNVTYNLGWISTTSATIPDPSLYYVNNFGAAGLVTGSVGISATPPKLRISVASTTTVYISVQAGFTASTMSACGGIYARRRR